MAKKTKARVKVSKEYKERNDREEERIKARKKRQAERKQRERGESNMPSSMEDMDEGTKRYLMEVYRKAKKDKGAYGMADTLINKDKKKKKKSKTAMGKVK